MSDEQTEQEVKEVRKLTWEPIRDIIMIRPLDDTEEVTGGRLLPNGLVIPEEAVPRRIRGIVVKAGPECKIYGVGDLIVYQDRDGVTVEISGRKYLAIYEERGILRIPCGQWSTKDAEPGPGVAKDAAPQALTQ